ncbi:CPBP family intramembrane glutamic endopeptidase [Nocardia sp. CC227C]|uniref:CPBP family intramembrane glutamic endopeptidase n=1 Tax=Nocardia sp. CC227C TaxID=3044562 RepID=UPI00278BBB27|nr:CPBP family intramembrane glutamic endopeptidase [Nocardia sp. CC227C]
MFFALTFVIGWGLLAVLLVFTEQVEAVFGAVSYYNPVFILAVYSPAIAGLALVWRCHGVRGVLSFLRRFGLWRMPAIWWVLLVLGVPVGKYVSAALNGTVTEFPISPWYGVFAALIPALLIGPVEEIGWHGVARPLLQRRYTPLTSALIVGVFWGLWHLPAFALAGTEQHAWSFGPFFLGALALSVLMTPLGNASGGSILLPALFHFQANGPAWPEGQPWENYVFAIAAVLVVLLNRNAMLRRTRDPALTEVLMPAQGPSGRARPTACAP